MELQNKDLASDLEGSIIQTERLDVIRFRSVTLLQKMPHSLFSHVRRIARL